MLQPSYAYGMLLVVNYMRVIHHLPQGWEIDKSLGIALSASSSGLFHHRSTSVESFKRGLPTLGESHENEGCSAQPQSARR